MEEHRNSRTVTRMPRPSVGSMDVLTPAVPSKFFVLAGDAFVPGESLLDSTKDDTLREVADNTALSTATRL